MTFVNSASSFNNTRFVAGERKGHYESYFLRANHPSQPLAFWIRYTVFVPKGYPDKAVGEIWATWFNGDTFRHVSVKEEFSDTDFKFGSGMLDVRIGLSTLTQERLKGSASLNGHAITWDLCYHGEEKPLFLFPLSMYGTKLPKAKSLVGLPCAEFTGSITTDGMTQKIDAWIGSQNHNWGSKHTDDYAWGQVAGFDNAPGSFLELATARIKIGPFWTPRMTLIVLRYEGREYALNTICCSLKANGRFGRFFWNFSSENKFAHIEGEIVSTPRNFVGLRYHNPPGGDKFCLNCKIASGRVKLTLPGEKPVILVAENRAAFEILTDDPAHGVPMYV